MATDASASDGEAKLLAIHSKPMPDYNHFDEVLQNLDIALTYWTDERALQTPILQPH